MWSVLSVMLCESVYGSDRPIKDLEKSRKEERKKFLEMSPVFWMRVCPSQLKTIRSARLTEIAVSYQVEDLKAIINTDPKYAHLINLNIRTTGVDLSCSTYSTPIKLNNGNGNGPMTPMSASITKEEMALRLERLFGAPPPRALQLSQVQAQPSVTNSTLFSSSHPTPNNNSASMPPPTPVNATNAASTSSN